MVVGLGRLRSSRLAAARQVSHLDFVLCVNRYSQRIFAFIRYAYASSADGRSFRAHGELAWGDGNPKWVGLIAKNSNNDEPTSVDASFDCFELRQRLPGERPVYLYVMPAGGVDELKKFIGDLRAFSPQSAEEAALHSQHAPPLLKAAAQRILQVEEDLSSEAYQLALLVLLEDRIRTLPTAVPAVQQQTVDLVKVYLTAKTEELGQAIGSQDTELALSVGDGLERAGNLPLAKTAYRTFAEWIAQAEHGKQAAGVAMLKGAARRLELVGEPCESEFAKVTGARLDWETYRGKVVLILFVSGQSDASLQTLRRVAMLYPLYRDRGFEVLCIATDREPQTVKELLQNESLPWTVLLPDQPGARHPLVTHLGVATAPMMLLVDSQGKFISPRLDANALAEVLDDLIGPPYEPKGKLTFVDLPSKANQKLSQQLHNAANNDLKELPLGEHTFAGVTFQISDALAQLAGQDLQGRPEKITGIPVDASFDTLYVLHGTGWKVDDGSEIGQYRVHYSDGAVETIPIVYGRDVRNWQTNDDPLPTARSVIAWTGQNSFTRRYNATVRLYLGVWHNPRPADHVTSIDFLSDNTRAAPFCVAMTIEQSPQGTNDRR